MPKASKHPEIARFLLSHRSDRRYPPYGGGADATSKAARVLEARLLSSVAAPATVVDELIAAFVINTRERVFGGSTQRRHRRALRLLSAALGPKPIAAVTVEDAEALYTGTGKTAQGVNGRSSEASRREAIEMARLLWNFGQSRGMCTTNPFRTIRVKPRIVGRSVLWNADQLTTFIAAADRGKRAEIGAAAALAYWLSLWMSEVLAISPRDLDGTMLSIRSRRTRRIARRIELNPYLIARVRDLFGASTDLPLAEKPRLNGDAFRRAFARIRQQAGLPAGLTFRALRLSRFLALHEAGAVPPRFASSRSRWAHPFMPLERIPDV